MATKQILLSFEGRIPRSTWWLWSLAVWGASFVIAFAAAVLLTAAAHSSGDDVSSNSNSSRSDIAAAVFGYLVMYAAILAFGVVPFWTSVALGAKRLHDQNRSGMWLLLYLIPYAGPLVVLILCGFIRGTDGPNRFEPGHDNDRYGPAVPPSGGAPWANSPPPPPSRRPNEPFFVGHEWRSYDSAGRLLRWDDAAQTWVPIDAPPPPPPPRL